MLVPKPLPSAAGHYLLRQSKLSASGRKLSDMPMALPLGATATTAASGGNREELLGPRPAGCERQRSRRWEPQPVLAQRLAFFRFDNSFGIIKGEQPLIRASRASKVAGAFLVLFWCAKENLTPRNSALLYYTPNPPDFYDQVSKASIFRPSATLQGRASVLYFL